MIRSIAAAATIFIGALSLTWASAQPETASPLGVKLFDDAVAGILEKHCVDCHGGRISKEAGFDLMTREGLLKGGDFGPGIIPGDAARSQMMVLVRHEEEPFMPEEKPKLDDAAIAQLAAWIDAGAPYTRRLTARPEGKE